MLNRDEFEKVNGDVAVNGARYHVKHCEEDRVTVTVEAEEVLVEEQDSNVG